MDSITQALLGAAIGEAVLGKKVGAKAAIAGAIIATIPDLDVLFYLFYNSYDMLSIHRGISHSIVFSILASLLIAFILSRIKYFVSVKYSVLLLFSWLCLITHLLLDAFTVYGTQLFLPFSNTRVGFDSINVVDPVYTMLLFIGLLCSLFVFKNKSNRVIYTNLGLLISTVYLVLTLFVKQRVNNMVRANLKTESIHTETLLTVPVGVANINWYGVAKTKDSIYIQKTSVFKNEMNSFESFPINNFYLDELKPEVAEKMKWFSKGFYTVTKTENKVHIYNLQVDMRGITIYNGKKVPTKGYFEITNNTGETIFSSKTIKTKFN